MKKVIVLIFLSISVIFFSKCTKDLRFDESSARLMVVNTVPGAPSIEAFLDNTILHVDPMKYLANTYYRSVISGERNFKIRENGNLVVDTNFVFDRAQTYSIFVFKENTTTKILLLKDDIKIDENGLTRYRFLNFSPNAGTLNVYLKDSSTAFISNLALGAPQNFSTFTPLEFQISLKDSATSNLIFTSQPIDFKAGKILTLFVKGIKGVTNDDSLGIHTLPNYLF